MKKLVKFEAYSREADPINYMFIEYYIHGVCKFNCKYCFAVDNKRKNLELESQLDIIDTLYKIKKPFVISYFGGEPSEYKYLYDLTSYICDSQDGNLMRIDFQTNLNIDIPTISRYLEDFPGMINFAPSIHIGYLRGDTIYDLVDKIDCLHEANALDKIAFMLGKTHYDEHYKLHTILKGKPYYSQIEYIHTYAEFENTIGTYTGRDNTTDIHSEILSDIDGSYSELFKLTYDDDTHEICSMNELFKRDMNFKGWLCDAGKFNMHVDFTGDYWYCAPYQARKPPIGNLLKSPSKFLALTKAPHRCTINKCDGNFWVAKKL